MLLRQAAFAEKGAFLKGNLHCHTTRSDGQGTPQAVIGQYAASSYDFLALTDHDFYNYKSFSPETEMLILPGMEIGSTVYGPYTHCAHVVAIGPEKENGNGFEQDQRFSYPNIYRIGEAQCMIDDVCKNKNLPIYCHPEWSGTPTREIEELTGFSLMEIWNSGCVIENGIDNNAACWDELLANGRRIYGVATDDGHNATQNCHGFVRVRANNTPSAILDALRRGAFYASCGPEIYDFYVEDGVATVACSPAASIRFRHLRIPYPNLRGDGLTAAQTAVRPGTDYIRAEVTDHLGQRAWTNPIFFDP